MDVQCSVPLALGMLLRDLKSNERFRIVTPEGAGYFTVLCNIDTDDWPFAEQTAVIRRRLREDEPDESRLVVELDDPWSPLVRRPRPNYDQQLLDRNYALIAPLINSPKIHLLMLPGHRNRVLNEHAAENGTTRQKLSRLLKRFWKRGLTREALMDDRDHCGGPGKKKTFKSTRNGRRSKDGRPGIPITETHKKILRLALDWLLKDRRKRTYQQALDHVALAFCTVREVTATDRTSILVGLDRREQPTVRQLQYLLFTERPLEVRRRAKLGDRVFDLIGRAFRGREDQRVTGPGDEFVLDATIADVYLVSQFDRLTIAGRPTVYFAIDVFSRMVVGLYVGFEPPSWTAAMVCLTNIVTPKIAYCASFGIEITEQEWASHHLSTLLCGDKGEMMKVQGGNQIVTKLHVMIDNTPSGRPDTKAIVETRFRTIPVIWRTFAPGYVERDFVSRMGRDYRLDAALNLYEFTQMMILAVLEHNSRPLKDFPLTPDMVASGYAPTPNELWEYGVATLSGTLVSKSIDEVRRCVLPRDKATVTHKGLSFKTNFYKFETNARSDWFIEARNRTFQVEIAYDPRDLDVIWLCEGEVFEKCVLAETTSKDIVLSQKTLVEWNIHNEHKAENTSRSMDDAFKKRIIGTYGFKKIAEHALREKRRLMRAAGITKLSVKGIREAHARERDEERRGVAGIASAPNDGIANNGLARNETSTADETPKNGRERQRAGSTRGNPAVRPAKVFGEKAKELAILRRISKP